MEYFERGWHPLPLDKGTKTPPPSGFTGGSNRFPTAGEVSDWIKRKGAGNVALRAGHDVIGLDVDSYKCEGARGDLERLIGCELPPTWMSSARAGGSGIYWYKVRRLSDTEVWRSDPVTGVETVRFGHRYAVAPPSLHPKGMTYQWHDPTCAQVDQIPHVDELTEMPAGAQDALLKPSAPVVKRAARIELELTVGDASTKVGKSLTKALRAVEKDGGRHDAALDHVLALLRHAELEESGVVGALEQLKAAFVGAVGPDRGDLVAIREFESIVAWARTVVETTFARVSKDGLGQNDIGNADRLIALHGNRIRYVPAWEKWLVYQGGRWKVDGGESLMFELAKDVVAELREKGMTKWADASASANKAYAMIKFARGVSEVRVDHEDLDSNPYILNCLNGTVDLRTGELRPHDPADLCSMQAPVEYDPDARAPLWESCLVRWHPDAAMREYLQREAGAGATGVPTETFSIYFGDGGNGKGKFLGAISEILGSYAVPIHKSLIISGRFETHDTVKASLYRVRLATVTEAKPGAQLDEASVKGLTGGDRLRAHRMRQDEWSFDPTHTLVASLNHKFGIEGLDDGIWRRVRLVPWDATIPLSEQDPSLAEKLRAEHAGILRWMVEGAVRFLSEGFDVPLVIEEATREYRNEEDSVGRFLHEERVRVEPGRNSRQWMLSSQLAIVHEVWCEASGQETAAHMRLLTARLKKLGAKPDRKHVGTERVRGWRGVSFGDLEPEPLPDETQQVKQNVRKPSDLHFGTAGTPVPFIGHTQNSKGDEIKLNSHGGSESSVPSVPVTHGNPFATICHRRNCTIRAIPGAPLCSRCQGHQDRLPPDPHGDEFGLPPLLSGVCVELETETGAP